MEGPQATMLPAKWPNQRRLHLHHGPIDLIVEAFGPAPARAGAYRRAVARFRTVLDELVAELPALRAPAAAGLMLSGPVARRMRRAVAAHLPVFVTPMAAVAGAVADEICAAMTMGMTAGVALERAYVNNGGDVALYLAPGQRIDAAIAGVRGAGRATVRAQDPARGLATSGWRGRSHSLGIADAVTVIARSAAAADVAATLIANAVDLPGHPAISRRPARELSPDSDLGARPVTTGVGPLTAAETAAALDAGAAAARAMAGAGLIGGAALFLGPDSRLSGALAPRSLAIGDLADADHPAPCRGHRKGAPLSGTVGGVDIPATHP